MKKVIFTLLISCVSAIATAQVTLDSCRMLVRRNYPTVKQYELVAQSEQYSLSNAARAWLPQVRLSAQATWQTDAVSFPDELTTMLAAMGNDLEGMRRDQYKIAVEVSQNIWDGGKSIADKQLAHSQAVADKASLDVDLYQLDSRVDNLFFGILLLSKQRQQTDDVIHMLQENWQRAQSMVRNEVLTQSDADGLEAELVAATQRREQISHSEKAYREMLSLMVGRDLANDSLVMPEMPDLNLMGSQRPELQLLDAQSGVLSAQESTLKSLTRPQVGLFAQGWYGYPGLNMFENMRNADWSLNAIVGIMFNWNISGFYTKHNRLAQIDLSRQQLQVQREVFEFNNSLQLHQENSELERLRKTLHDDDRIVTLRQSIRHAAESKWRNEVIGTSELLQKINDEANAQSTRAIHKVEMLKKAYEICHTLNQ